MARPKKPTDELKDQRVPLMLSEAELLQIDDWRFENRISSRGEAIRRLCRIGILWDGVSDLLQQELEDMITASEADIKEALENLGQPSDKNPPWVNKFVIAILKAHRNTFEHVSKTAGIIRMAGSPSDVMKLEGEFNEIHGASLVLQSEILNEALDEYRAANGKPGEEEKKDD